MKGCLVVALAFLAVVQGKKLLRDGKEYTYESEIRVGTGTMDYAPTIVGGVYRMTTRVQVSNGANTLNVEISGVKKAEYMGAVVPHNQNTDGLAFSPAQQSSATFQVNLNSDGTFKSFKTDATNPKVLNVMRGWASMLQVKRGSEMSYVSEKEKTVQGECNVKYTVSPTAIYKSVVHLRDCKKRPIRVRDDWGGFPCDYANRKESMEGIVSSSNTIFNIVDDGPSYKIQQIVMYGAIVSQMFEVEGVSHLSVTNVTHTLVRDGASSGNIGVSGRTYNSVAYEFADRGLQWNANRNLKDKEPFFSSGQYMEDLSGGVVNAVFKSMIDKFLATMEKLEARDGISEDSIRKAHFTGINRLAVPVFAMDYNQLKTLYTQLSGDSSDDGVKKFQIFRELIGAAGSSAAAILVKDMIMNGQLEDRDGARMLSSIPYHIRFPSKQLMNQMGQLLNLVSSLGPDKRFTKMAIPLSLGHLVRRTCERAGEWEDWDSKKQCVQDVGATWVGKFKALYDGTSNKEEKSQYLNAIFNMRWGVAGTLSPLIKDRSVEPANRVMALYASIFDLAVTKTGKPLYFELFADATLEHEVRIAAVQLIFFMQPTSTDIAQVTAVLRNEKDYEVINFVFALMEKWATDIEPCSHKTAELSAYFLKYLKQLTGYQVDWGFGVSKTYKRSFVKKKYGYSGSYNFWTLGSHESTTPISVGMELESTTKHSYKTSLLGVYLRIEGLAKGLIRKFKTMDPTTWKTEDLQNILMGQMGITPRPDQPIRVQVTIAYKNNIVIHRMYDSSSAEEGGSLQTFFAKIKDLGNQYSINHQRVIPVGSVVVEQPSVMGLPTSYVAAFTTMGDIKGTVKRGNSKGTQFRTVNYDIRLFTQGMTGMMVRMPFGRTYLVNQDRIYFAHFPRDVTVGVNLLKKELKLDIGRPEYNHPLVMLMHSATYVAKREHKLRSAFNMDPANTLVVTRGGDAAAERTFIDVEDTTSRGHGLALNGKYFRCEMDIARRNTIGRGLGAFMPYNKSPKTPWTMFSMGMRQIRAFMIYFPKAQQCGARLYWSQSQTKPIKSILISITGKKLPMDKSKDRGFIRAGAMAARISITGKGETPNDARRWKIEIRSKGTAGGLKKSVDIDVRKKFPSWVVDAAKVGCLKITYKSTYPQFANEFMGVDLSSEMVMNANLEAKWGIEKGNCDGAVDGHIKVDAKYKTRTHLPDVKRALQGKWYYKQCMEAKNSPSWRGRPATALPMTMDCFYTAYDATVARDYSWDIQFLKVDDRVKEAIKKVRSIVNFAVLTLRGTDLGYTDPMVDLDPRLRIHAILKDGDSKADVTVENARMISQGEKAEIKDYDLKLGWGPRMLRNLKFSGMVPRLYKMGLIKPCIATIDSVMTMDNVTYSYSPSSSCNTLMSGHCAANPSYAVFTKKNGNKLALTAFIGGHKIEIDGSSVKINGDATRIASNGPQKVHKSRGDEIFSIFKWGNTYNIYSFLKVWIVFDGSFVEVVPAPSVKGNHCGLCGNFNRNKYDEFTKKDGTSMAANPAAMVSEYCWQ